MRDLLLTDLDETVTGRGMETAALAPQISEEVPSMTVLVGFCFWPPANPKRITKDMEDAAERLYTGKGLEYFESLENLIKEIEHETR